jgi:molybdopterin molybdotransferase
MDPIDFPTQLSVAEAQRRVIELCAARRLPHERVGLRDASTRVLAGDVIANGDLPPFANSAMDGFALRGGDLPESGERRFRIVGTRLAGNSAAASIGPSECLRITTGAPMPAGADTVVIKERVRVEGDELIVAAGELAGANMRPAGEDYRRGEIALRAGQRITPARLGVLASLGLAEAVVARRPRVAVMTTGDELVMPGSACGPAQIYNSNGYSLSALLAQAGGELCCFDTDGSERSFRHLRDDPAVLRAALLDAALDADVIVTSGGVSAGEADFLPGLLAEIGRVHFWKVRMRPGMPILCGEIGNTLVFGLPGNPVSSIATFLALVRPALAALQGAEDALPHVVHACLAAPIRKRHDRTEFQRARSESREDGSLWVTALAKQGSGMLRGVVEANALIVVPESVRELDVAAVVQVMPLPDLG